MWEVPALNLRRKITRLWKRNKHRLCRLLAEGSRDLQRPCSGGRGHQIHPGKQAQRSGAQVHCETRIKNIGEGGRKIGKEEGGNLGRNGENEWRHTGGKRARGMGDAWPQGLGSPLHLKSDLGRTACDLHFNTEPLCSSFLIYLVSIHVAHEDRKSNSTT